MLLTPLTILLYSPRWRKSDPILSTEGDLAFVSNYGTVGVRIQLRYTAKG